VYRDFHRSLRDHGYNATPFHTAWLGAAVRAIPATRESMLAWASVDMLAYLAALAAILWAFGAPAAAVAALLFGLGDPWSFSWTGGSIARTVWLAVFCWGWALLRRRHPVAGTAMLAVSAMLRLFPAVFVAAVGLFALLRRREDGERGRVEFARVAGSAVVTLALGVGAVGLTHRMGAFSAFGEKALLHASVPPGNHLGLRALVLPGGSDHPYVAPGDATAPESTQAGSFGRTAGLLAWILGLVVALALLLRSARRATAMWEALPYAAPLLFASIPLSGYDYVWLAVLAPLAAVAPIRLTLLVGLAAATTALGQLLVGLRPTYLACNVLITGVLIAFFRPRSRPWPFRRPDRGR
jgi:hypothetical protein